MATKATSTNGATTDVEPAIPALKRLDRVVYQVPIVGDQPLIVNRWTNKAREMMLAKQQTQARMKKEAKDPATNFEASKYRLTDGREGFPSVGFKAAIVHAARLFEGVTMVAIKQTLLVIGQGRDERGDDLVVLDYDDCTMREDTPRNATGVADLRYRAMYTGWRAVLNVRTLAGQIDQDSLFSLCDAAGVGGVGEWRPTSPKSATGSYGTFHVEVY